MNKLIYPLVLFFIVTSFTSATFCYSGSCIENSNCTVRDQVLVLNAGNQSPAIGANVQFQVTNSSGFASEYLDAVYSGNGFWNGTYNLTRGNYCFVFNASYGATLNSTGTPICIGVVPACRDFQIESSNSMQIELWALFFLVGLALIIVGMTQRSKFITVMGGFITIIMGIVLMTDGVVVNFITVSGGWILQLALIALGIGLGSMYYGAVAPVNKT